MVYYNNDFKQFDLTNKNFNYKYNNKLVKLSVMQTYNLVTL